MAIKRNTLLIITAIVIVTTGCGRINRENISPTQMPIHQSSATPVNLGTITPSSLSTDTGQVGCFLPPTLISNQTIRDFQWSDNSEQIFYREKFGQSWYSYDTVSGQTDTLTAGISPTSTEDPQNFGINGTVNTYVSPRREIIIFTRGSPEKQEIYYKHVNEKPEYFLGTIQGYIKKVDWFPNQEKAIIAIDWQSAIGILDAYIYTIDFSANKLVAEIPKMDEYKNIEYLGLTPDETRIMFVSYLTEAKLDRTVKLWDISTNEIESTSIVNPLDFRWISQSALIGISQKPDLFSLVSVVIYDISNSELTYLADGEFSIDVFIPNSIQISPSGSSVAYIENKTNNLYWTICQYRAK